MKKIISVIGLVSAAAVSLGVTTTGASVARASSAPKVQEAGMSGSWHSTWGVRPRTTAFGAFYEIRRIRWSSWTSSNAYGRGHLVACAGAAGPCRNGVVNIHLYGVHSHSGPGRYFSNLRYSGSHSRHLWITSRGYWNWR